jgi:hypothetical protein
MLNKGFIVLLLLLFLAAPATVMGKDIPVGKWWHRSGMASKLNLSEAEKDTLDQKYIESRQNSKMWLRAKDSRWRFSLKASR